MNVRIGPISRLLSPGFSWCHRCRTTWRFVDEHTTWYTTWAGCFPLCEKCWADLGTPEARMPYYNQLIAERGGPNYGWTRQIREAVEAGR